MVSDDNYIDEFTDQNGKVAKKGDHVVFGLHFEVYCGEIIKCHRHELIVQVGNRFTHNISVNSFRFSVIINKNIVWLFKK